MDIVLSLTDTLFFDRLYATLLPRPHAALSNATAVFSGKPIELDLVSEYFGWQPSEYANLSLLSRDNDIRLFISLFLITWYDSLLQRQMMGWESLTAGCRIFGFAIYFGFASFSYVFIFDKDTFKHPKFLKNQMRQEITQAMYAMPLMAIPTTAAFWLEVKGYSKLYMDVEEHGWWYMWLQFPLFMMFTDCGIYWIHRGLHHPAIYKRLHKPHHKWIMPTPFASHAFHPMDGFAQSVPYHLFPFILPLHKIAYLLLFTFINIWTVMIRKPTGRQVE
jgi:lathosterol oxidase